jgi:hypothetical protein
MKTRQEIKLMILAFATTYKENDSNNAKRLNEIADLIMPKIVDLVKDIREILKSTSDENRLEIFGNIMNGYCKHCGCDNSKYAMGCQCWNDD